MVKIRLHGGFFVARLFPFKCCRRFTSFAICLQYPFGAGNRNTLLPRFLVFSGFITGKVNGGFFRLTTCNLYAAIQKGLFAFFSLQQKISAQRQPCTQFVQPLGVFFVSIWQNCNADAEKFCLQCLQCKREKPQISHNVSRVRNLCNRWVFFVSIWQNCNADAQKFCLQCLQCKREKLQISAQRQPCTQFVQPLGVFCQFGKIAMQMRKNFVCDVCRAREKNHKIPLSWRLFA